MYCANIICVCGKLLEQKYVTIILFYTFDVFSESRRLIMIWHNV